MRKLIALVFHYSLIGLLADEGTEYWDFCFELLDQHGGPDRDEQSLDFLQSAYVHIMGHTAYEGMAANLPTATKPPVGRPHERRALSPQATLQKRSTSSGRTATATSWSGAESACGGRSCSST